MLEIYHVISIHFVSQLRVRQHIENDLVCYKINTFLQKLYITKVLLLLPILYTCGVNVDKFNILETIILQSMILQCNILFDSFT